MLHRATAMRGTWIWNSNNTRSKKLENYTKGLRARRTRRAFYCSTFIDCVQKTTGNFLV